MQTENVNLGRSLQMGAWIAAWIAGVALSAFFASAHAGVRGSKHDMGVGGLAQQTTTATTEVCSFCHTPHGSDTTTNAPLWNKRLLAPAAGYRRYSTLQTSTLDGGEAAVGSVSLACLSCHDGTQAMDVVINKPGSGGYNAVGAELDVASIVTMTGGPIPMLGTDLSNDHPISIQYGGGGCSTTNTACTNLRDRDFRTPVTALINSVQQWWVDTLPGTTGTRDKTDMILYTRSDGSLAAQEPFVECGSCHDPHEDVIRPVSFMRLSNAGSDVCLACHIK
jgi:hypothetical protein